MDSSKIGSYNPDGSIREWPQVDITGQMYERGAATVHGISASTFIVLPPGYQDTDGVLGGFRAENAPKAAYRGKKEHSTDE